MRGFFNIVTIISAILIIVTVLLQSQGTNLGTTFGGEGSSYRSKRGAEKLIFNTTIVMAVMFTLSVVLSLLSKK